jgi:hypothetical protein
VCSLEQPGISQCRLRSSVLSSLSLKVWAQARITRRKNLVSPNAQTKLSTTEVSIGGWLGIQRPSPTVMSAAGASLFNKCATKSAWRNLFERAGTPVDLFAFRNRRKKQLALLLACCYFPENGPARLGDYRGLGSFPGLEFRRKYSCRGAALLSSF